MRKGEYYALCDLFRFSLITHTHPNCFQSCVSPESTINGLGHNEGSCLKSYNGHNDDVKSANPLQLSQVKLMELNSRTTKQSKDCNIYFDLS